MEISPGFLFLGVLPYNHAERATVRPPEKSCPVMLLACLLVVVVLACLLDIVPRRRAMKDPKSRFVRIQKSESIDKRQRVGKIAG